MSVFGWVVAYVIAGALFASYFVHRRIAIDLESTSGRTATAIVVVIWPVYVAVAALAWVALGLLQIVAAFLRLLAHFDRKEARP